MENITKAVAIFYHRKMYHRIAARTRQLRRKVKSSEYFNFYDIPDENRPSRYCYACQYDMQIGNDCSHCPINWGNSMCCLDDGSPYREWHDCRDTDWERAADLADKIAELPEKILLY